VIPGLTERHIQLLPIYTLIVFAAVSATIVIYRTLTFTNCDEAAESLKEEMEEAKDFLKSKGLVVGS